jgi:hypothetical protein
MTRCFARLLSALISPLFAMTAQANIELPPPLAGKQAV